MVDVDHRMAGLAPAAHAAGLRRLSTCVVAAPASASPRHGLHSFHGVASAVLSHLRESGVAVLPGLSDAELARAEAEMEFTFPPDLRAMLALGLSSGPGFPDWQGHAGLQAAFNLPVAAPSLQIARGTLWPRCRGCRFFTFIWRPKGRGATRRSPSSAPPAPPPRARALRSSWVAVDEDAVTVPPPPFLDRAVVVDPDSLAARTLDEMRQLAASGPPPPTPSGPPPKLVIASLALTRDCIDNLKQRVIAKGTTTSNGGGRVHCSAFTVACAFAWACLVRVDGSCTRKKRAHLLFSMECHGRLTPLIPQEYLGNCLRPCFVEVDMGDLLGADGVMAAATAIGVAIKGLDEGVLNGH